jgi:hypothetical protein
MCCVLQWGGENWMPTSADGVRKPFVQASLRRGSIAQQHQLR